MMIRTLFGSLALAALAACSNGVAGDPPAAAASTEASASGTEVAIFGGGCFWCMEPPFDKLEGVHSTTSGYIGGHVSNPTYEQVSAGGSGHVEVVAVQFDPTLVDYAQLLEVFWRNIDPIAVNRQFCDSGPQYRSAIFVRDGEQRRLAEASLRKLADSGRFDRPIATEILDASTFYEAEEYHQDYYLKNPVRYRYYRSGCGRDKRLNALWGDAD